MDRANLRSNSHGKNVVSQQFCANSEFFANLKDEK